MICGWAFTGPFPETALIRGELSAARGPPGHPGAGPVHAVGEGILVPWRGNAPAAPRTG